MRFKNLPAGSMKNGFLRSLQIEVEGTAIVC
jgi:hypothetical protein